MFATQPFQLTLFLLTTYLDMLCTVLKVRSGCGSRCATLPRQAYCAVSGGGAYMQGAKKKEKLSKDPFLFSPEVRQRAVAARRHVKALHIAVSQFVGGHRQSDTQASNMFRHVR